MRTQQEIGSFYHLLGQAGLALSNRRAHTAIEKFKAGEEAVSCIQEAQIQESKSRQSWIDTALDPWCKRHGLTRAQGLSVAFDDDSYNPANPSKDQVTLRELFAWGGQQNDFAGYLMREAKATNTQAAVEYTEQTTFESGAELCFAKGKAHGGWLWHNRDKTYFALFPSLDDALHRTSPLKEWEYQAEFESFEDEVIGHWLMTGVDAELESLPTEQPT